MWRARPTGAEQVAALRMRLLFLGWRLTDLMEGVGGNSAPRG